MNHIDDLSAEEALRSVFETLPGFVMWLDREYRIRYLNRLVAGLNMEQVIGASAFTFVPPDSHDVARQAFEQAWHTGKPTRYQIKGTGDHGSIAWYSSFVGPVIKGGNVVALVVTTEDITEHKRAEDVRGAMEVRFRAAIDGALDVFAILTCARDPSGKIVDFVVDDVNTRAAAFVKLSREALLGRLITEVLPNVRADGLFDKYVRAFETQQAIVDEQKMTMKDGTTRWTSHQLTPLPEGVAVSSRDITGTKQLEADLRDALVHQKLYAEELEKKNKQLFALSVPIIQAWEEVLVLPVIGVLDNSRAQQMMEKLLGEIVRTGARFAILDLTGVDAADASTVDHILRIVLAANLLGSRCLISGISPAVARTMVETTSSREGLMTFGLLRDALRHALLSSGSFEIDKLLRAR